MTATFDEASDAMASQFWEAWKAATPDLNDGNVIQVRWPGVAEAEPPAGNVPWARFTINHFDSAQQTLAPSPDRVFNRAGIITVQIFAPLNAEGGLLLLRQLCTIAKNAYEGISTSNGIWFRNVRIQEVGATKNWYQHNVLAEFTYDEIK